MQPHSTITTQWDEPHVIAQYETGVSLHSHTSLSEESLEFIQATCLALPGGRDLIEHYERRCRERYELTLDFERARWRPPLLPRMAYELESEQIQELGLYPLISITDRDTMEAAILLRTIPPSRHIPISVEWSVPFGQTVFHLGIHNLPSADGSDWMRRFATYTADPNDDDLLELLRELDEEPQVLIVLNHPLWNLNSVGWMHMAELMRFIAVTGGRIHALELNGLRHMRENREVERLARDTGYLLISGGDRHGLEPSANINLTCAASFAEFIEEIRIARRSHVHFMNQYQENWEQRILRSALNAVTDFPQFVPGWQRWDERVFHPDPHGTMRPLSELWPKGRPPLPIMAAIQLMRLGTWCPVKSAFSAIVTSTQMKSAIAEY